MQTLLCLNLPINSFLVLQTCITLYTSLISEKNGQLTDQCQCTYDIVKRRNIYITYRHKADKVRYGCWIRGEAEGGLLLRGYWWSQGRVANKDFFISQLCVGFGFVYFLYLSLDKMTGLACKTFSLSTIL